MTEFDKDIAMMDRPEIIYRLFFPRREDPEEPGPHNGATHFVQVAEGIWRPDGRRSRCRPRFPRK